VKSYFDTSALVPLYLPEIRSDRAREEARRARQIPYTPLHALEVTSAIHLNYGRRLITAAELRAVSLQIEDDLSAHRLRPTPLDLADVFASATAVARQHAGTLLCRSLDVLHVATALHLRCAEFVSAAERQLQLARAVGLDVVDLGKRRSRAQRS
jgi:predicted nucleic acid-binding protein